MRFMPYILIVLLALTTTAAVVTRDNGTQKPKESLADRINEACKPLPLNDWWIDSDDPSLIRVNCYDPKTSALTHTVVER